MACDAECVGRIEACQDAPEHIGVGVVVEFPRGLVYGGDELAIRLLGGGDDGEVGGEGLFEGREEFGGGLVEEGDLGVVLDGQRLGDLGPVGVGVGLQK